MYALPVGLALAVKICSHSQTQSLAPTTRFMLRLPELFRKMRQKVDRLSFTVLDWAGLDWGCEMMIT
jgi:hypothetical protein